MNHTKVIFVILAVISLLLTVSCTKGTFAEQSNSLPSPDTKSDELDYSISTYSEASTPSVSYALNEDKQSGQSTVEQEDYYTPGNHPTRSSVKVSISDAKSEKIVFLTFDDGPSIITRGFLDVLKANNVHGTFCVIGDRAESYPDIIRRMYSEGHSIISHSHTHIFNEIYASPDAFLRSIEKSNDAIDKIVNRKHIEKAFLRFPGGATGKYKPIARLLDSKGFNTLEWNVSSNDCFTGKATTQYILANAIHDRGQDAVVVLMHDYKYRRTTLEALPGIIKHYKDKGYSFRTIRDATPMDIDRLKDNGVVNVLY